MGQLLASKGLSKRHAMGSGCFNLPLSRMLIGADERGAGYSKRRAIDGNRNILQ
jgi:hypothetical protein